MELLAPAGTLACVKAAINSGVDAVYFAGKSFGARSFAGNLSDEEIFYATDYCHLRGCRAYVTVNTLGFDREFAELEKFIKVLSQAGADGVIVQDLGIARIIREVSPDIELHGSTQMTVHSAAGVKAVERRGMSRVVLSRELSKDEIAYITANVDAETEVFVHGAMCMSYSGQCLMSSVIGGRSGNRGKCAQPCRLTFSADGKSPKHYLSMKDMSYASHICELEKMGVASLKIEGRMKGEEYVSAVVSTYRRLIDERRKPTGEEIETLNKVFYRGGLTDGYYIGKKGADMFAFDKPDNPYLKNDMQFEVPQNRQIETKASVTLRVGEKPEMTLESREHSVTVFGESCVASAEKRPLTAENVKRQLAKTGNTLFELSDMDVSIVGDAYLPISQLNELRRSATDLLEEKILAAYKNKRICARNKHFESRTVSGKEKFSCSVLNIEQYRAVCEYDFDLIYMPTVVVERHCDELLKNDSKADRVVVSPPVIIKDKDRESYKNRMAKLRRMGFKKAEVHTIDGIDICEGYEIYTSHRMNITNSEAVAELTDMGIKNICLSTELTIPQIRDISKIGFTELTVYGRIPLMITENCILKNMGKCPCDGNGAVIDRTGARFPIVKDGDICRSVVLNNVPLYTADKINEVKSVGVDCLRLAFTDEDADACREICEAYIHGKDIEKPEYTRLHLFKGALS